MTEQDDFYGWMCACGHWEDSHGHCSLCKAEPPWGCDCGEHDSYEPEGWEDGLFEDYSQ